MQNNIIASLRKLMPSQAALMAVFAAWFILLGSLFNPEPAYSGDEKEDVLQQTIQQIERKLDARIGVMVMESASDWQWGHREHERFLMNSTFKSLLCAAVLDRADRGLLSLDEAVVIKKDAILDYAPVTKKKVGQALSIKDLCIATLDLSDNTAANLLIERLGGPHQVTNYLKRMGDEVTRLDRMEPEVNYFAVGDPRDTTTPAAIVSTWKTMLTGDGLETKSRTMLAEWMSRGGVTGEFFRAVLPAEWKISDKSGGGREYTRSLVAMITPPDQQPYFAVIFVSDTLASWSDRNDAVIKISNSLFDVILARVQSR